MRLGWTLVAGGALWALAAVGSPEPVWTDAERAETLSLGWRMFRLSGAALGLALASVGVGLARSSRRPKARHVSGAAGLGSIAIVLVVATVLRAIGLGSGLWYDEVVTLVEFVRLSPFELLTTYTTTNNHLLFSLAANASVAVFGESAWALRLPAAAFGVASVGALFAFGTLVVERREALLASLLLAVSYHHIWFSQNARGYTGILLWALLATALFVHGIRARGQGLWLGYALVVALALYTHLSSAFVFAAHGGVFLWLWLRSHRSEAAAPVSGVGRVDAWPVLGFGLGVLLTIQLYAPLLPQVFESLAAQANPGAANAPIAAWKNPLWTALEILRGFDAGPLATAAVIVGLGITGLGVVDFWRRDRVATALMLLPSPLTLAALLALSFHIWPRYFLISAGFGALFLVRGFAVVAEFAAPRLTARGLRFSSPNLARIGVGLVITASLFTLPRNYALPKQDYAGARDFIRAHRDPGDSVVTAGLASLPYSLYYAPEWQAASGLADLDALVGESVNTWLVYSFPQHMQSVHPDILSRARRDFALVRTFPGTLGDGEIYVLRRALRGPATGDDG